VFHARFVDHRYPPHTHDAWTVLIVDSGAIRYDLDRHEHGSGTGTVTVLPPYVVHDGRAADGAGFRKRVLYLDPALLGEGLIGPAVDHPTIGDQSLRHALGRLHETLLGRDDLLAGEAKLAVIVEELRARLTGRAAEQRRHDPGLADSLRQLLDAHLFDAVTLTQASETLAASPTHLVRSFTRSFGISPHAYVVGRRIDEARRRLLQGEPAAVIAPAVGFHDQSHLTRHFKRHVGTTPGRYARPGRLAA
jgi:AraC-like DNA-binding protein